MGQTTTNSTQQTSGPSNPDVNNTTSLLAQKLGGLAQNSPAAYGQSLYAGVSPTTRNAWAQGAGVANNIIGSGGFNGTQQGALGSYANINSGYGQLGQNGGLNGTQQSALGTYGGIGNAYGAMAQNGGLTGAQSAAMGGVNGLNSKYAGLAGAYDQNAPGFQTMRQGALDDAITGVTAGQLSSGLLGSRSYIQDATKAGVNAIAPLDYQNFQNSVNNKYRSLDSQRGIYDDAFGMGQTGVGNQMNALSGQAGIAGQQFAAGQQGINNQFNALSGQAGIAGQQFAAGQQGLGNQSAALAQLGAIGGAQDADMAAQRQGDYDLYTRQTQAPLQWYQGVTSAANGNAATSPQQQTSSTQMPWWMAGLGAAATGAGIYGSFTK